VIFLLAVHAVANVNFLGHGHSTDTWIQVYSQHTTYFCAVFSVKIKTDHSHMSSKYVTSPPFTPV